MSTARLPRPPRPPVRPRPAAPRSVRRTPSEPASPAPEPALAEVRALADQGRTAEALVLCSRALDRSGLDSGLLWLKAVILQELHRDEEAMASLRNLLSVEPHHVLAHLHLGHLHRRRGEPGAAQTCFEKARGLLEFWPDAEVLPASADLTVGALREILEGLVFPGRLHDRR